MVWSTFTQNIAYRELKGDTVVSSTPVLTGYHIEQPTMATQGTTNHVAWKEYSYDDLSNEICYTSGSSGIWNTAAQLTHAAGESRDPSLVGSGSKLHLLWADNRSGTFGVYYTRSDDGMTWSEEKELVTSNVGAWNPSAVPVGDDCVAFVYEENHMGVGQIRLRMSLDGGSSWENSIPVSDTSNHCTNPAVAADDVGNIYISWQEYVGGKWKVDIKKIPFTISGVGYVSSAVWTGVVDVKAIDNYAYCAFWNGVGIMDISDPTQPALLGKVYTQGRGWGIDVVGFYAYLADDWTGLKVVDISNPFAPVVVGSVDTAGSARAVAVQGNYAYVADMENGLQIVDVSTPSDPLLLGQSDTIGDAVDIDLSGEYAYIADSKAGLAIFDISNPHKPELIASLASYNGYGIFVRNGLAYLAAGENGLVSIDISDPHNPIYMDSFSLNMAFHLDVEANFAYVIDLNKGFFIIDVSDPYELELVGHKDTEDFAYRIDVRDQILYVADGWTGCFTIWDISNFGDISLIGQYWSIDETYDVFYDSGRAYVTGGKTGLFIVDVSVPIEPILMSNYPLPGWENRSGTGGVCL
ncbi:hypothetical protein [Desulfosporosinus sp.]|uniref:hypothetical protein n=1 Tax=Desulfosporosinus sp. TaxID=157907 RepID=UPI0025C04A1C|nr:hypothetical protein [Desulfosporosinus sp.]MBC2726099.1 hypothetical protein [Desulfosporosinus sp.]